MNVMPHLAHARQNEAEQSVMGERALQLLRQGLVCDWHLEEEAAGQHWCLPHLPLNTRCSVSTLCGPDPAACSRDTGSSSAACTWRKGAMPFFVT